MNTKDGQILVQTGEVSTFSTHESLQSTINGFCIFDISSIYKTRENASFQISQKYRNLETHQMILCVCVCLCAPANNTGCCKTSTRLKKDHLLLLLKCLGTSARVTRIICFLYSMVKFPIPNTQFQEYKCYITI